MKIQKGKISPKHVVLIGVLVVALYAVFPSSEAPKTESAPADATSAAVAPAAAQNPESKASVPAAAASPEPAKEVVRNYQSADLPLSPLTDEQFGDLLAANPFFTPPSDLNGGAESDPDADLDGTAAAERIVPPIEQLAGAATVSLLYSSSRGTKAAVVDGEIVRPGQATTSGLRIEAIDSSGVNASADPDSSVPLTAEPIP
jgi:hypothetical protein